MHRNRARSRYHLGIRLVQGKSADTIERHDTTTLADKMLPFDMLTVPVQDEGASWRSAGR